MKSRSILIWFIVISLVIPFPGFTKEDKPEPVHVTNRLQEIGDRNNNRLLEPEEIKKIVQALIVELSEPHPVTTRIGEIIDRNGDKKIDAKELDQARNRFVLEIFLNLYEFNPEVAKQLDANNNGQIDMREARLVKEFLFLDEAMRKPHKIKTPLDRLMDKNKDGNVGPREIKDAFQLIYLTIVVAPSKSRDMIKGQTIRAIEKAFDLNADGSLALEEFRKSEELFARMPKKPHKAKTQFDDRIDLNKDSFISIEEIGWAGEFIGQGRAKILGIGINEKNDKAIETLFEKLGDMDGNGILNPREIAAMKESMAGPHKVQSQLDKKIDFNKNGNVDFAEIEKVLRSRNVVLKGKPQADSKYPVSTSIDEIFDLDGDGFIVRKEMEAAVGFFLKGPHKADSSFRLDVAFDLDRNGRIEKDEIRFVAERYLRPHSVDTKNEIDRKSDKNSDGFIEPKEIGIAAGAAGAETFDSFEAEMENKALSNELESGGSGQKKDNGEKIGTNLEEPGFQKKPDIEDKYVALAGLNAPPKGVDKDTIDAVSSFIENAFINLGNVKFVDRRNMEKILSEQEFRLSDLVDQSKSVKVGELAGAEILITGEINNVGSSFYLTLRLVLVDTGEIVGSSVGSAKDEAGFYDMCNSTVSKLF